MTEPVGLLVIGATFLVAGAVKGVIGLGLPTVSLGLLAVAFDLASAMALLIVPSLVTNLWQGLTGGRALAIMRRTWPFMLPATLGVWAGVGVLTRSEGRTLLVLLGALLVLYAAAGLGGLRLRIPPSMEAPLGLGLGLLNGLLAGMTGSFVVPGVLYLQGLGLEREALVQAMGILFTLSTLALALALRERALLPAHLTLLSAAAVVPALAGMAGGQWLRRRLAEERFRRLFFAGVLALGGAVAFRALLPAGPGP